MNLLYSLFRTFRKSTWTLNCQSTIFLFITLFTVTFTFGQKTKVAWGTSLYTNGNTKVYNSSIDRSGNLHIVGTFKGTMDFDPGSGVQNKTSAGPLHNIYILKLDPAGKFIWVRIFEGTHSSSPADICFDSEGNPIITGRFTEKLDVDPLAPKHTLTATVGNTIPDVFVCKLSNTGSFMWAVQLKGILTKEVYTINIDSSDNIYYAGYYTSPVDFDPGPEEYTLSDFGGSTAYVCKLDVNGNFVWARAFLGTGGTSVRDLQLDKNGNVLCMGWMTGVNDLDPGPEQDLFDTGGSDFRPFIAKLDNQGIYKWGRLFEGKSSVLSENLLVDDEGATIITGNFTDNMDANPGLSELKIYSKGKHDNFVIKLNSSGVFDWFKTYGSLDHDAVYDADIDKYGDIYLTGYITANTDFDPGPNKYEVEPFGTVNSNAYVLKLDTEGNFRWVKHLGTESISIGEELSVGPDLSICAIGGFVNEVDLNTGGTPFPVTENGIECNYIGRYDQVYGSDNISSCNSYTWKDGITYTENGSTANYYFKNQEGQDSMIVLNLTLSEIDISVVENNSTLTANLAGAGYQWLDCNNGFNPVIGATGQSFLPSYNSSYAVEITSGNCIDTSTCFIVTVLKVKESDMKLSIFPNPTNGLIILDGTKNIVFARIIDISGRSGILNVVNNEIEITDYKSGCYFLELEDVNKVKYFSKVIKM